MRGPRCACARLAPEVPSPRPEGLVQRELPRGAWLWVAHLLVSGAATAGGPGPLAAPQAHAGRRSPPELRWAPARPVWTTCGSVCWFRTHGRRAPWWELNRWAPPARSDPETLRQEDAGVHRNAVRGLSGASLSSRGPCRQVRSPPPAASTRRQCGPCVTEQPRGGLPCAPGGDVVARGSPAGTARVPSPALPAPLSRHGPHPPTSACGCWAPRPARWLRSPFCPCLLTAIRWPRLAPPSGGIRGGRDFLVLLIVISWCPDRAGHSLGERQVRSWRALWGTARAELCVHFPQPPSGLPAAVSPLWRWGD